MKTPTVTIITVTYNAEKFLERTLKSVIEQKNINIEYIIIDGGSNDKTVEIIKEYEKYISYWISEPDNGIYDAMNKGIDIATGEWINFMNAGDTFSDQNSIEDLFSFVNHNVSLIYGGVNLISFDGVIQTYLSPKPLATVYIEIPCCHQSAFFKTSVIKKYRYDENYCINSDVDLFIRLEKDNHEYSYIDYPVSNFLLNGFHTKLIPKAYLEILYINSRYLSDPIDIYKNSAYHQLIKYEPKTEEKLRQNKISFCHMMNDIMDIVSKLKSYETICLYGYNSIAKMIEKQLDVTFIIDRVKQDTSKKIFAPKHLKKEQFDVIFICVLGREEEVKTFLMNQIGVEEDKIITL